MIPENGDCTYAGEHRIDGILCEAGSEDPPTSYLATRLALETSIEGFVHNNQGVSLPCRSLTVRGAELVDESDPKTL